jgi:hypothetical protein
MTRWLLKFGPLVVSLLSLALAGYSHLRVNALEAPMRTRGILEEFEKVGRELPTANSCFRFANRLEDEPLRAVFKDNGAAIDVPAPYQEILRSCLKRFDKEPITRLEAKELDDFRRTIFYKLNSYDRIFIAISNGEGLRGDLCRTAWPSYSQEASKFLARTISMSPLPEEFQDARKEYAAAIRFNDGGVCKSAG